MLMLALTCIRTCLQDEPVRMVMQGQLTQAVRLAMVRLEKRPSPQAADAHALLGQIVGRSLLALGREEEAEELFRRQLRIYEMSSRACVRWMSSMDQGAMQLALNRLSRAADAFNTVADDETAPVPLRVEALAGLSVSLRGLGEYRRADRTLSHAQGMAQAHTPMILQRLLEATRMESSVLSGLRAFDEGSDVAPVSVGAGLPTYSRGQLLELAGEFDDLVIARRRLTFLAALLPHRSKTEQAADIVENLHFVRQQKLAGHERECRMEAALALVGGGEAKAAHDVLESLAHDEESVRRHRYSLELKYCISRIYALQGRHADALRLYKEHVNQAMGRLRAELAQLPYSRCLEKQQMAEHNDSMKMLLPLRYRRAYQYIVEHLDDRDLSVREVAAHIDVTERALQMAFRSHLGMAPAELIRRKRMDGIRKELREAPDRPNVLDVAQRWGMTNRSTLTQNYRHFFKETPTTMLRGGAPFPATPGTEPEDLQ